jgi:hypothetical protein
MPHLSVTRGDGLSSESDLVQHRFATPPPPPLPKPYSAPDPITHGASGSQQLEYVSSVSTRDEEYLQMAEETSGRFVGPMPTEHFMDTFLPFQPNKKSVAPSADAPADCTFQRAIFSTSESTMSLQLVSCKAFDSELVLLKQSLNL